MMADGVVFRAIIGFVFVAGTPDEVDYFAVDVIPHPEIPHIHAFGFAGFHDVVHETMTNFVVGDEGGGWLRVFEFLENVAEDDDLLGVNEECGKLSFSS